MKRVHIFGCSFSADYDKNKTIFPLCDEYIKAEEKDGNFEIQGVNYWFKELFKQYGQEVEVRNYAAGGNSNEQIFHDFYKYSKSIRPKDYIFFQTTFATRVRVVNLLMKKWINFQPPIADHTNEFLQEHTTYTPQLINKICLERSSSTYLQYLVDHINFIRRYANLNNAYICSVSLDTDLFVYKNIIDIPKLYGIEGIERIQDKYPHIEDKHLSYSGIKTMVDIVVRYFMSLEEGGTTSSFLSDERILQKLGLA